MIYEYKNKEFNFTRYPKSENHSLKPWSAADEHVLKYLNEINYNPKSIAIFNDKFGFISCILNEFSPIIIFDHFSQIKAVNYNIKLNKLNYLPNPKHTPLDELPYSINTGIIKIPKSLEQFRLYLYQLSQNMAKNSIVICSFMTRHFTPQMIEIAEEYFEQVEQSRAWKKSRLLILKNIKPVKPTSIINTITINENTILQQYYGVFSSKNIDPATKFLIEHLTVLPKDCSVLDLGSGNGILSHKIRSQNPKIDIHLLDNSFLAIASSKLNLGSENTFFHYNDSLVEFNTEFFDLVVSNPPFHFEYEINIEVSLGLFKETHKCLKINGRFLLVANKHLNYIVHLAKIFKEVIIIAENKKFIIYKCIK